MGVTQLSSGMAEAEGLPASPASIRVATYNVTGDPQTRADDGHRLMPFNRALSFMASGLRDFDVVALQEVESPQQLAQAARAAG
jgi:hypothetical protein